MVDGEDKPVRGADPDAELKRLIEGTHRRMKWTLVAAIAAAILSAIAIVVTVVGVFVIVGAGRD